MLEYTLAFILRGDSVLMLRRSRPPNASLLNGVGGKIKPGETPLACVLREVQEETGIDIRDPRFAGTVTWKGASETPDGGMYVFLCSWPEDVPPSAIIEQRTDEGSLEWLPVEHVVANPTNSVVSNIPQFLPQMLSVMRDGTSRRDTTAITEG